MELQPLLFLLLIPFLILAYFWLRMGPKRCPNCKKLTWGIWGPHIGIRKMYFKCPVCGTKFEGNKRLPL